MNKLFPVLFGVGLVLATDLALAQTSPASQAIIRYDSIHHPVVGNQVMVVSQRQIASDIGRDILAQGGNAVDAGVAVGFALEVVLPRAGNIGGGGFMLIHLKDENKTIAIDYRDRAPAAAHKDLFLDESGDIDPDLERFSHRAVGVPGTVAGLTHALDHYGTLSLAQVLAPSIELAEQGFVMDYDTASAIGLRLNILTRYPGTKDKLFKPDGSAYEPGELFVQPKLAQTLRRIADNGRQGFYQGSVANQLVAEMKANNGLITHDDLKTYQPTERKVLQTSYRGYDIISMPPPSSGGVHLLQMLNVLEHFDLKAMGLGSAQSLHVMAEAMKLAYADQANDSELMQHLEEIVEYAIPKMQNTLEVGKELYEEVSTEMSLEPIGIMPLYQDEGYLIMQLGSGKRADVYEYRINKFVTSGEGFRGIYLNFLHSVRRGIGDTFEQIKLRLIKAYQKLPNPATYLLHAQRPY
ncbi:MAG: gamma-glutamyltransferase, partial [Pseudomonadota bacterium]